MPSTTHLTPTTATATPDAFHVTLGPLEKPGYSDLDTPAANASHPPCHACPLELQLNLWKSQTVSAGRHSRPFPVLDVKSRYPTIIPEALWCWRILAAHADLRPLQETFQLWIQARFGVLQRNMGCTDASHNISALLATGGTLTVINKCAYVEDRCAPSGGN
ncbi:hypothetical protein BV22DRAFT_377998 [Leucogyrophana mollusca]|uniref:Uncharacterized protein n=1 Tax=Leucogyrophana mollusca TaxID=85980 RepID=A0ACB8BLW9_9AGAM|nr:hypothetical protein BV22DRAFT_377998 [Leucogyrophana mollusca]